MTRRKPHGRRGDRPPCDEFHADDGADPRRYFGEPDHSRGEDRKTQMLCAQVGERVRFVLSWQCDDPALADAEVADVVPCPDASRLRIEVVVPEHRDPRRVEAALERSQPLLRAEVAAAIHRRKVPQITFRVATEDDS